MKRFSAVTAVDSALESRPALTHHRESATPVELVGDTSTELVLAAVAAAHPFVSVEAYTANHWDIDGHLAAFSAIYPAAASKLSTLLAAAARIGDFRELRLAEGWGRALLDRPVTPPAMGLQELAAVCGAAAAGAEEAAALRVCVWLNAEEGAGFATAAFEAEAEAEAGAEKYRTLLPVTADALGAIAAGATIPPNRPAAVAELAVREYRRLVASLSALAVAVSPPPSPSGGGGAGGVRRHDDVGLVCVRAESPLHYYVLFSHSHGADYVLSLYPPSPSAAGAGGVAVELEAKYTSYVTLSSRLCLPRVPFGPLADALNRRPHGVAWVTDGPLDTGPILRSEDRGCAALTKAQRYASPDGRPHYGSGEAAGWVEEAVVAYLRHALRGVARRQRWGWDEVKEAQAAMVAELASWRLPA